jgi:chromosome segregation ATPase
LNDIGLTLNVDKELESKLKQLEDTLALESTKSQSVTELTEALNKERQLREEQEKQFREQLNQKDQQLNEQGQEKERLLQKEKQLLLELQQKDELIKQHQLEKEELLSKEKQLLEQIANLGTFLAVFEASFKTLCCVLLLFIFKH